MGILTETVEVRISSSNAEYYKNLGYEIPMKKASARYYKKYNKEFVYDVNKPITVKVKDLPKQSHATVKALCDYCNEEIITLSYDRYNNSIKNVNKVACAKCRGKKQIDCNLLKYGVNSPSQLDYVKEKVRQSNLAKYGVDNYAKTEECREKMKNTIKSVYGVDHYSQTDEYKEKFRSTCLDRYGENYNQQFADKAFETFRNRTGYDFPSQSPEVREKIIESCVEHYGVISPAQSPEIREKMVQTLYANSSQKASKQQRYINELYSGVLNFPIKHYNADIYLLEDNLVIEYDGGGHMLNVIMGRETIKEYTHKEIIRHNVIKSEGYRQMTIISRSDKLPSDTILLQMLQDARIYFSTTNHSWIEFNIDTSTFRNAENPTGSPYNFESLRTIKDSDLDTIKFN